MTWYPSDNLCMASLSADEYERRSKADGTYSAEVWLWMDGGHERCHQKAVKYIHGELRVYRLCADHASVDTLYPYFPPDGCEAPCHWVEEEGGGLTEGERLHTRLTWARNPEAKTLTMEAPEGWKVVARDGRVAVVDSDHYAHALARGWAYQQGGNGEFIPTQPDDALPQYEEHVATPGADDQKPSAGDFAEPEAGPDTQVWSVGVWRPSKRVMEARAARRATTPEGGRDEGSRPEGTKEQRLRALYQRAANTSLLAIDPDESVAPEPAD